MLNGHLFEISFYENHSQLRSTKFIYLYFFSLLSAAPPTNGSPSTGSFCIRFSTWSRRLRRCSQERSSFDVFGSIGLGTGRNPFSGLNRYLFPVWVQNDVKRTPQDNSMQKIWLLWWIIKCWAQIWTQLRQKTWPQASSARFFFLIGVRHTGQGPWALIRVLGRTSSPSVIWPCIEIEREIRTWT